MRLVRARTKAPEDMPPWTRCCVAAFAARCIPLEMVVDLDRVKVGDMDVCPECRKNLPTAIGVMDVEDGLYMPLDTLELDEGEVVNVTKGVRYA